MGPELQLGRHCSSLDRTILMTEDQNLNMDFSKMTIADVEALVRKKADRVELQNKWVCITFGDTVVKVRNWK